MTPNCKALGAVMRTENFRLRREAVLADVHAQIAAWPHRPGAEDALDEIAVDRVIVRLDKIFLGVWKARRPWPLVAEDLHDLGDYVAKIPTRAIEVVTSDVAVAS